MVNLKDFSADVALLFEGGLMAIKQGDEENAKKLFNAVGTLQPEGVTKKMGYGLIAIHKLEAKEAQKIFKEVYEKDRNNKRAQAFLAFAYMLSLMIPGGSDEGKLLDLKEATKHATEARKNAKDESTIQLAQSILDWQTELDRVEKS